MAGVGFDTKYNATFHEYLDAMRVDFYFTDPLGESSVRQLAIS